MRGSLLGIVGVAFAGLVGACESGGAGHDSGLGLGLPPDGAIRADASLGLAESPYIIGALPYLHAGDTAEYGQALIHSYSCAENADKRGPELWYYFSTDHPIPARFELTPYAGVDVDLHLVQLTNGNMSCLTQADTALQFTLQPGTTYIVVDTPVIDGTRRPGGYDLRITASQ